MTRALVAAVCVVAFVSAPAATASVPSAAHRHAAKKEPHKRANPERRPAVPKAPTALVTHVTHSVPPPNPVAALAPCADATLVPDPTNLERVRVSVLCLANQERAKQGVGALTDNALLRTAADTKAADMVANDFFEHTSPAGVGFDTLLRQVGYVIPGRAFDIAENLAWGQLGLATPEAIVAGWMGSPGHRANLLDPRFRESGLGVVAAVPRSDAGPLPVTSGATFAQEFGARAA